MDQVFGATLSLKDDFTRPMRDASGSLKKFSSNLTTTIKDFAGVIGPMLAIKKAFNLGAELEETQSKFNTVFGSMAGDTEKWISQMSDSWNKSSLDIKTALAANQDLLTGFGATSEQAAKLSKEFVTLGTDVGSFANVDAADAMDRITKAMLGEHEAVKMLGIALTEPALKQKALEMGFKNTFVKLQPLEKMQVRYALALDQTKNAQNDAGRTAWSFTNTIRGILGATKDLTAVIGTGLTTAFGGLARDTLKALKVLTATNTGVEKAKTLGEELEPVIRNGAKAFVAYKLATAGATAATKLYTVWTARSKVITFLSSQAETIAIATMLTKDTIMKTVAATTGTYATVTTAAAGATGVFNTVMAVTNALWKANPIGMAVAGITALGAGFALAYKNILPFKDAVDNLLAPMGKLVEAGKEFFFGDGKAPVSKKIEENNRRTAAGNKGTFNNQNNITMSGTNNSLADAKRVANVTTTAISKTKNGAGL